MSNHKTRNPLKRWDDDRLVRAADKAEAELGEQLQNRRDNPAPDAVRAGVIADLTAEFRLYCAELSLRGLS